MMTGHDALVATPADEVVIGDRVDLNMLGSAGTARVIGVVHDTTHSIVTVCALRNGTDERVQITSRPNQLIPLTVEVD